MRADLAVESEEAQNDTIAITIVTFATSHDNHEGLFALLIFSTCSTSCSPSSRSFPLLLRNHHFLIFKRVLVLLTQKSVERDSLSHGENYSLLPKHVQTTLGSLEAPMTRSDEVISTGSNLMCAKNFHQPLRFLDQFRFFLRSIIVQNESIGLL